MAAQLALVRQSTRTSHHRGGGRHCCSVVGSIISLAESEHMWREREWSETRAQLESAFHIHWQGRKRVRGGERGRKARETLVGILDDVAPC